DVRPSELEDQKHLRCPAADAADHAEPFHDLVVGALLDPIKRDGAVCRLGGQVTDRGRLRPRQPGGSESGLWEGQQPLRWYPIREIRREATVDRRRRPTRQLLERYRPDQPGEGVLQPRTPLPPPDL